MKLLKSYFFTFACPQVENLCRRGAVLGKKLHRVRE